MKTKALSLIGIFLCAFSFNIISQNIRTKQIINREWKFILADVANAESIDFNDSEWENIHLPHSFSLPYFMWNSVYQGYGWYRKEVDIPVDWKNKNINLEFEGAFIEKEVYINGKYVGKHVGGYTGFNFDITIYLQTGKNVIAVRVNNLHNPAVAPRTGDHQFSGGIYRDVYLNVTDKLHIDVNGTFVTTPEINEKSATCQIQTEVRNNYAEDKTFIIETEIKNPKGKVVARTQSKETAKKSAVTIILQKLPAIKSPKLWSPESPELYNALTTIYCEGKEIDNYQTTFGIRKFEWTADKGFFLNGNHYFLRGANVHQDQAGWGDAVTNAAIRRDVEMIKDAGFNCIRGSHYPHDPAFTKACDEIGIILLQENAFWGMGGGSGDQTEFKLPPPSCYPVDSKYQDAFDQSVISQLKEMIKTHRNGASIAAWSLCNEPFFTDNSTDKRMKNLLNMCTDSARIWDPTREVAIGGCQRKGIDVLGKGAIAFYNGGGEDFYMPGVPNLVSEYGSTVAERPGRFIPGWSNIAQKVFEGGGDPWSPPVWRSGHIIWCGFDHGTIGGRRLATMGMIDYFRIPKRQYYWYLDAYKNGNHNPVEPEWAKEGIPAKLKLEASKTTLSSTDGTDDTQLIVTVLDASGKHINNSIPVELSIVSGPGEFPTGTKIKFMPHSDNEESDITISDGLAAISFRSYYAGKTVIKAVSPGLESAAIEITTHGSPEWVEGITPKVKERPYKRFVASKEYRAPKSTGEMLLAKNRPSWVSSTKAGTNKTNVNDDNKQTIWQPAKEDQEKWWKLDLEAAYCINQIQIDFPDEDNYSYQIEVSSDGRNWKKIAENNSKVQAYTHKCHECNIAFVRIIFHSEQAGLAEVKIGGTPI